MLNFGGVHLISLDAVGHAIVKSMVQRSLLELGLMRWDFVEVTHPPPFVKGPGEAFRQHVVQGM